MRNLFLLLLVFVFGINASAQITDPDTTQQNYPPFPKINLDSAQTIQTDTSLNDSMIQSSMTQSKDSIVDQPIIKSNLRSPSGALLRSLAVPGWGQLYNRKYFKSVIVAGGQGTLLGTAIVEWQRAADAKKDPSLPLAERLEDYRLHTNNRNMLLWLYAAAAVVSMLDAYVDAHLSQDTGVGVPQIGHIFLEPDADRKSLLLKLKINF